MNEWATICNPPLDGDWRGRRKGAAHEAAAPPSMGLRPSLYIMRGGGSSLGYTLWHNFSRCPADPFLEFVAWRSPARRILHHHHALCCWDFPKDLLLPLPRWTGGRKSSSSRTCDGTRSAVGLLRTSSRSWDRQVILYPTHENRSRWKSFVSSRVSLS